VVAWVAVCLRATTARATGCGSVGGLMPAGNDSEGYRLWERGWPYACGLRQRGLQAVVAWAALCLRATTARATGCGSVGGLMPAGYDSEGYRLWERGWPYACGLRQRGLQAVGAWAA